MKRTNPERPSDREAIEARAAAWLAERDDGLNTARADEFARWCAADTRHAAAVARLERAWTALQQLRDFRPEAARHPDRDLLAPTPRRQLIRFPAVAGAALAAALAVAAVWWFRLQSPSALDAPQVYATTVDGYERVNLEDGSQLELNANTEVRVTLAREVRRVQLARGEAHFTVAKDPQRPFVVQAGGVAVRAVGTAFSVRLGASDVEVLVTEGRVEVGQAAPVVAGASERTSLAPARGYDLLANQRAVVSAASASMPNVETLAPDALRAALAWQGPRLVFTDTPLAEALAQFNRRNAVQLVVGDDELNTLPIGGSFRPENFEAFLRLLETGGDIALERPEPGRIVLRRKK